MTARVLLGSINQPTAAAAATTVY